MSNAVKALPDSLAEGMNKVSDNMGRMSERLGQDIKQSILKVTPPPHPPEPFRYYPAAITPACSHTPRCLPSSPRRTSTPNTAACLLSWMTT